LSDLVLATVVGAFAIAFSAILYRLAADRARCQRSPGAGAPSGSCAGYQSGSTLSPLPGRVS
jgi:hypothetical protein